MPGDPFVSEFPGLVTLGAGTFGLATGSTVQTLGRQIQVLKKPAPDGPDPPAATAILPEWRLAVYWAGDAMAPTYYLDRPNAALGSADSLVTDWGAVVETAKGADQFARWSFRVSNAAEAGSRFSDEWSVSSPPEGVLVQLDLLVDTTWETQFTGAISEITSQTELEVALTASSIAERYNTNVLTPIDAATWPQAPAASLSRFQPIVFGTVEKVEGVLVEENLSAALASSLTSTATTVEIEEDPGLTVPGSVRIDDEELSFTTLTPGSPVTLTGVVRGTAGTTAADHPAGSRVIEVGTVTWLLAVHDCQSVSNVRLVDAAGNVREVPAGVTVTPSLTAPTTVQLDRQPILASLGSESRRVFKYVDLDTVDSDPNNTSTGFTVAEVENMVGRADGFTETNTLVLSASDPTRKRATAYRANPIVGLPSGANLTRAYLVVEHYLAGDGNVETTLVNSIVPTDTGDIEITSEVGFQPTGGVAYFGEERVTYATATGLPTPRLTGVARGTNTIGALSHPAGTRVVQSPIECFARIDTSGSTVVSPLNGEGFATDRKTVPEEVTQDTGLTAISHGFEDAHTHVIPGSHEHDTDTAHTHNAPVILDWQPSLVQGRIPKGLSPQPCSGGSTGWFAMENLIGSQWGDAVDGNVSTAADFVYAQLGDFYGFFFVRSTSADLSPNDTRSVEKVEVTVATSKRGSVIPGEVTTTWDFNSGLGICQVFADISTSSVGGPVLNISSSVLDEAQIDSATAVPGGDGNLLSTQLSLAQSVADYNANPDTIFVETFTVDVSSLSLTVADFVDRSYGGTTGKSVWLRWKAPNLEVHLLSCRLILDEPTDSTIIPDPLEDVAWPDTDSAAPLKSSTLTWFDLSPKVSTANDILNARVLLEHSQTSPFIANAEILRAFWVLELDNVVLSGGTEVPTRLVADVQGLTGTKATDYMAHVLTESTLLGLVAGDVLDQASLDAAAPQVQPGAGVVYDQIRAPALINELGDNGRLTPYWNEEGKLAVEYRADKSDIANAPTVFTFRRSHLVPTAGGPIVHRAPLRDLINDVTVRAKPDTTLEAGFAITSTDTDSASQTAYGRVAPFEYDARFLQSQVGADDLSAHVLDYNAALPPRVTIQVHIEDDESFAPRVGQKIGVDTPEYASTNLVVEERVIVPGRGRDHRHAFVQFTAVDRT